LFPDRLHPDAEARDDLIAGFAFVSCDLLLIVVSIG
jgi:hypothetical protein